MLEVRDAAVSYGSHRALDGVSLSVARGEIVVILGANGAGKTTLLKAIAGLQAAAAQTRILLDGRSLAGARPHRIVEAGLALVPEGRGIFGDLTVAENLALGAYAQRARAGERERLELVLALFPKLAERRRQVVRTMSGGEQQMVAVGRALMSAPDILLLDEPSLGLSPLVCGELFAALGRVRDTGTGILLVEQNAKRSLAIADRGYLLENGRIVGAGSAADLRDDESVRRAYLGAATPNPHPTRENTMLQAQMIINNQDVPSTSGASFDRLNPISGEVATRYAAGTVDSARAAADAAAAAFAGWAQTGPGVRRALLNKAADLLDQRTPDFITAMAAETGAAAPWAGFNCFLAANMLREAASMTTQVKGEIIPSDKPGAMAMALRQPAGVVVGIAPWNAPVILGVRAVAMPLACGNTVVLKGSELCPLTHRLIGEVLREAGFPPGVVNVVLNAPDDARAVVNALIAHPAVRRVNFTGSTRVGRLIAEEAARHLKPCLLELGGKAPFVVLDDADLDEAVKAAAFGAFFNSGQICMSTERIIVDNKVADAFVAKFAAKAASLKAGLPGAEGCALGSMIGSEAAARVKALIDDAVAKGARLASGGKAPAGSIMQTAVLDHVTPAMRLYGEESFGPVAAVMRFHDIEEAVSLANDTEYGLSAAVFGRDVVRAMDVARRIESGICHINAPTVHDEGQMPFGGVKASGWGRFGGQAAIAEFTDLRWITIQTTPQHYPI
ncbi:MAG: aldehyde dehydrogenase family protein [Rhodocyclales bacterium]|nr:aldehyde dehydrogenase family protein [Rhodocyclales bacterium]